MASDCKVKDLVTVQREIRALLISTKHGCTPKQLQNDYLQVIGENIPYHFFGHSNFMSFIYSMPEIVSVCRSRNNVVLYGVADSKTRNIQKLVSKQRSRFHNLSSEPRMNMITSSTSPVPKKAEVPPTFKIRLKEFMLSHPNGIALKFFNEAFAKRFHYFIAFHLWGFNSLEAMISSVPEILVIWNDTTRNIKLVKRTPPPDKSKRVEESNPKKEEEWSINWGTVINELDQAEEERNSEKGQAISWESQLEDTKDQVGSNVPSLEGTEQKGSTLESQDSLHSLELSPLMKKKLLDIVKAPSPPVKKQKNVPWTIVEQIKKLLKANKSGIWVSRFLMEYKVYFKQDLDVSSLGYNSVVHMLHSLPCCVVEKPGGLGDWLVYLKGTTPPSKVASNHRPHWNAYLSQELIRAVQRTLRRSSKGIPLPDFPRKFKEVTEYDLPVEEMGFTSTADLLQRVPGVEVVRPPDSDSVIVFSTWSSTKEEEEEEEEERDINASLEQKKVPLEPQPSVYKQVLLPQPSNCKFQPVYVTEVRNPSSFSVQLIGKETTQVLECLQADMTAFYRSKEGESYNIEETFPGQPCCATFNNDGFWYRSEVIDLVCSDIVKILYVDYGNTAEIPLAAIRRPKLNYLTLPAQAIECRLCHVKPAGGSWSLRANQLLKQMTRDLPLVSIVTAVKNRLMSLYLVDTSTSRDLYINDVLVNQGLALFVSDTTDDENGVELYGTEAPLEGGDGRSVPKVRMPREQYKPPTSDTPQPLPSQHFFHPLPSPVQSSMTTTTPLQAQTLTPPKQHIPPMDMTIPLQTPPMAPPIQPILPHGDGVTFFPQQQLLYPPVTQPWQKLPPSSCVVPVWPQAVPTPPRGLVISPVHAPHTNWGLMPPPGHTLPINNGVPLHPGHVPQANCDSMLPPGHTPFINGVQAVFPDHVTQTSEETNQNGTGDNLELNLLERDAALERDLLDISTSTSSDEESEQVLMPLDMKKNPLSLEELQERKKMILKELTEKDSGMEHENSLLQDLMAVMNEIKQQGVRNRQDTSRGVSSDREFASDGQRTQEKSLLPAVLSGQPPEEMSVGTSGYSKDVLNNSDAIATHKIDSTCSSTDVDGKSLRESTSILDNHSPNHSSIMETPLATNLSSFDLTISSLTITDTSTLTITDTSTSTELSTTEPTSKSTCEPFTSESTCEPSTTERTSESSTAPSSEPSTEPTFEPTSTEPTCELSAEAITEPSTIELTSELSAEPTTEPAFELSTTEPAFELSTIEPTFEPSTTEPAFEPSTTEPAFEPSTTEPTFELSTTEPAFAFEPTFELSTTEPAFAFEPTLELSTTEPACELSTTEPTFEPSSEPDIQFMTSHTEVGLSQKLVQKNSTTSLLLGTDKWPSFEETSIGSMVTKRVECKGRVSRENLATSSLQGHEGLTFPQFKSINDARVGEPIIKKEHLGTFSHHSDSVHGCPPPSNLSHALKNGNIRPLPPGIAFKSIDDARVGEPIIKKKERLGTSPNHSDSVHGCPPPSNLSHALDCNVRPLPPGIALTARMITPTTGQHYYSKTFDPKTMSVPTSSHIGVSRTPSPFMVPVAPRGMIVRRKKPIGIGRGLSRDRRCHSTVKGSHLGTDYDRDL